MKKVWNCNALEIVYTIQHNAKQPTQHKKKLLNLLQAKLLQVPPFIENTLILEHISEVWETSCKDTDPVISAE